MAHADGFYYSPRYSDDDYEYRHVHCPPDIAKKIPKSRLMTESEWRELGVQQSMGWEHYMIHNPERHILLFRRPKIQQVKPLQRGSTLRRADLLRN